MLLTIFLELRTAPSPTHIMICDSAYIQPSLPRRWTPLAHPSTPSMRGTNGLMRTISRLCRPSYLGDEECTVVSGRTAQRRRMRRWVCLVQLIYYSNKHYLYRSHEKEYTHCGTRLCGTGSLARHYSNSIHPGGISRAQFTLLFARYQFQYQFIFFTMTTVSRIP